MKANRKVQVPVVEELLRTEKPVHVWAANATKLVARIYELDPTLSRRLEALIHQLTSAAGNLDCIGFGDPAAPSAGGSTETIVSYLAMRFPEMRRELHQVFARVDQLLGRHQLLAVMETDRI